jgi:hypothetical protein
MKSWKEWQDEKPAQAAPPTKKWKATKAQIMGFWQRTRPDAPITMTPIPYDHKGSTYEKDGIRVTGSKEFITSTIARLKEFLAYENPETKLMLVYRETQPAVNPGDHATYVFYLQAKQRGKKSKAPSSDTSSPAT